MGTLTLRRLTAPLYYVSSGHADVIAYLHECERNQWKTSAELQEIQFLRFTKLLQHAVKSVPFYRDLFQSHGLTVEEIQAPSDINRIPVVTRAMVQNEAARFMSDNVNKAELTMRSTSGSTGSPLMLYLDRDRCAHSWAYNIRHNRWAGLDWGAKVGSVWRSPEHPPRNNDGINYFRKQIRHLDDYLLGSKKELHLSPFQFSPDNLRLFFEKLRHLQPDILLGYSNSLFNLAEYAQANKITDVQPKGIISGGETLFPRARKLIEEVFGTKVYLRYGSMEFDIIASECEKGSLHVNDDNLLLEIQTEPGADAGPIVVSDLNNYSMPFIRYRLDDSVQKLSGSCACGRGLSLIGEVAGRITETFRTKDGTIVNGQWFDELFSEMVSLNTYQVRQTDYQRFTITLACRTEKQDWDAREKRILSSICEKFGLNSHIEVKIVDKIPIGLSGKHRYLISELNS